MVEIGGIYKEGKTNPIGVHASQKQKGTKPFSANKRTENKRPNQAKANANGGTGPILKPTNPAPTAKTSMDEGQKPNQIILPDTHIFQACISLDSNKHSAVHVKENDNPNLTEKKWKLKGKQVTILKRDPKPKGEIGKLLSQDQLREVPIDMTGRDLKTTQVLGENIDPGEEEPMVDTAMAMEKIFEQLARPEMESAGSEYKMTSSDEAAAMEGLDS